MKMPLLLVVSVPIVFAGGPSFADEPAPKCGEDFCQLKKTEPHRCTESYLYLDAAEEALTDISEAIGEVERHAIANSSSERPNAKEYICALTDGVEGDLDCYTRDFEQLSSRIRSILHCYQDGTTRETTSTFSLGGAIDIPIGKHIKLLKIEGTISKGSKETNYIYRCQNTRTGEIYTGTLSEIAIRYRRFLQDLERMEQRR